MVKGDGQQTRVFFKGSENDFIIFLDDEDKYKAWKKDSSVPLVDVVQSFQIFTSGQGAQGVLDHASHAMLDDEFGTHKEEDVVEKILKSGEVQSFSAKAKEGRTNLANAH